MPLASTLNRNPDRKFYHTLEGCYPSPGKILTFHIQIQDDKTFDLLITGNTWLFRDDLERHGVLGSRNGERYVRFLQNVDCTNDEMKQQVLSLVDIFRKQNIRVVVAPTPAEAGSTVAAFLDDEMSALPQFHFAS